MHIEENFRLIYNDLRKQGCILKMHTLNLIPLIEGCPAGKGWSISYLEITLLSRRDYMFVAKSTPPILNPNPVSGLNREQSSEKSQNSTQESAK